MKHHTVCYPVAVGVSCLSLVGTCSRTSNSTEPTSGIRGDLLTSPALCAFCEQDGQCGRPTRPHDPYLWDPN
jgi:hypothetical protein